MKFRPVLGVLCWVCVLSCSKSSPLPDPSLNIKTGEVLSLSVNVSSLQLLPANAAIHSVRFTWNAVNENPEDQNYGLQFSLRGKNFSDMVEVAISDELLVTFTQYDFNILLSQLAELGTLMELEVRLKATLASRGGIVIYSEPLAMTVSTYKKMVSYAYPYLLYVPGNYQNWFIPSAPQVVSPKNNGEYEGYIHFSDPDTYFLLAKGYDWSDGYYGDGGNHQLASVTRQIALEDERGIYKLLVNTRTMIWSAQKIRAISVIGTAFTDQKEHDLVLIDSAQLVWHNHFYLQEGSLQFRINRDPATDMGDALPIDRSPEYGAPPIPVTRSGLYAISIELGHAGNYTYSVWRIIN